MPCGTVRGLLRSPSTAREHPGNGAARCQSVGSLWHSRQGNVGRDAAIEKEVLPAFLEGLPRDPAGLGPPDYFEAVYVPRDLNVEDEVFNLTSIERVHFPQLLSRNATSMADEMDWHILPSFENETGRSQIPLHIAHIDVIAGCNFACPGCIEQGLRDINLRLSLERCIDILSSLKKCGCRKVGLYGGEPTLHPQFPLHSESCRKHGF